MHVYYMYVLCTHIQIGERADGVGCWLVGSAAEGADAALQLDSKISIGRCGRLAPSAHECLNGKKEISSIRRSRHSLSHFPHLRSPAGCAIYAFNRLSYHYQLPGRASLIDCHTILPRLPA
jgi:hypothetical protein